MLPGPPAGQPLTRKPMNYLSPELRDTRAARSLLACTLGAALALSATAVRAQTSAATAAAGGDEVLKLSEFQVSTTADKGYRAGNSVSATRIDTPIKDLPFAISAFTQQFISDVGARDLWDVVQYAPSVTSAGREFNAGNSVYTIRGFDQAPQHNGFVGEAYIDTVSVERVEVVIFRVSINSCSDFASKPKN